MAIAQEAGFLTKRKSTVSVDKPVDKRPGTYRFSCHTAVLDDMLIA